MPSSRRPSLGPRDDPGEEVFWIQSSGAGKLAEQERDEPVALDPRPLALEPQPLGDVPGEDAGVVAEAVDRGGVRPDSVLARALRALRDVAGEEGPGVERLSKYGD